MIKKHVITIDQLALMVKKGFDDTATKDDIRGVQIRVNEEMDNVRSEISMLRDEVTSELKQIKTVLGPLAGIVSVMEIDLNDLRTRVHRLERKAGIGK